MFQFEHTWILFFLPLPLLWRWLAPPGELQWQSALQVPFFNELNLAFHHLHSRGRHKIVLVGMSLIWLLFVIAAASPVWYGAPVTLDRQARNIMLAVDISGSMQTADMQWQGRSAERLYVVKKVAKAFIEHREGDRLGLILFGTRAYLQTPMTFDRDTVWAMLDDATVGLAGPLTAIGDAIGLAIKRLQQYPEQSRVLVLLTDGANNTGHVAPLAAAKMAVKYGIRIYTIGLGAEHMMVQGFLGPRMVNTRSDLDEGGLKKIANETGGKYFRARSTLELQQVYQDLDELEPVITDQTVFRPKTSLYPWVLLVAFLFGFLLITPMMWRRAY